MGFMAEVALHVWARRLSVAVSETFGGLCRMRKSKTTRRTDEKRPRVRTYGASLESCPSRRYEQTDGSAHHK